MIISIGIDIFKIKRLKKTIKIKNKILNQKELLTSNKNTLIKKFTIKEAIVKTIGTGFTKGLGFKKIIINKNFLGKPFISKKNQNIKILITLSHEKEHIISLIILFKFN